MIQIFLLSIEHGYTLGLILVTNDAVSKTTKTNKKVVTYNPIIQQEKKDARCPSVIR
jgi:hypothetical protein